MSHFLRAFRAPQATGLMQPHGDLQLSCHWMSFRWRWVAQPCLLAHAAVTFARSGLPAAQGSRFSRHLSGNVACLEVGVWQSAAEPGRRIHLVQFDVFAEVMEAFGVKVIGIHLHESQSLQMACLLHTPCCYADAGRGLTGSAQPQMPSQATTHHEAQARCQLCRHTAMQGAKYALQTSKGLIHVSRWQSGDRLLNR